MPVLASAVVVAVLARALSAQRLDDSRQDRPHRSVEESLERPKLREARDEALEDTKLRSESESLDFRPIRLSGDYKSRKAKPRDRGGGYGDAVGLSELRSTASWSTARMRCQGYVAGQPAAMVNQICSAKNREAQKWRRVIVVAKRA